MVDGVKIPIGSKICAICDSTLRFVQGVVVLESGIDIFNKSCLGSYFKPSVLTESGSVNS